MCGPLLLINLGILVADLFLLVDLSDSIGGLPTILLTIITAAVGISAVKDQGAATLVRMQQAQMSGSQPAQAEMIEGPLLALAGLYLLIPGFITDGLGALLLLAPVRRRLAQWMASRMGPPPSAGGSDGSDGPGGGPIIVVRPVDRDPDEPRD
jgi:UPF0716 protein FxsA